MFGKKTPLQTDKVATIIGEEAYFQGTLTVKGSLRIDGQVEGNISDGLTIIIGEKGRVKGDICAENVVIAGSVTGNVAAVNQIELLSQGRLEGDLRTPRLSIEEGATFEGRAAMLSLKDKNP